MPLFLDHIFHNLRRKTKSRANPFIRKVALAHVDPDNVQIHLCGDQINTATYDLVASAEEEVLLQFYIYENHSQAGKYLRDALIALNNKKKPDKIKIRFLIDHRAGPAEWLTQPESYRFDWLLHNDDDSYKVVDRYGDIQQLVNLDIQYKIHDHYFFNSYHIKQIIVDRKKQMLRSGDICNDSNVYDQDKGWTQVATTIYQPCIAKAAAKSFLARWEQRYSSVKPFAHFVPSEKEANVILLERNPSTDPLKRLLFDAPLKQLLLKSIANAQSSIKIMVSNINDPAILLALKKAIERNVKVELVTGKFQFSTWEDQPTMGGSNLKAIISLYKSLPIKKWDNIDVRWACDSHSTETLKNLILDDNYEAMHGKVTIIDETLVFAGSSPLDIQSTKFSGESDYIFESPPIADKYIKQAFEPVFGRGVSDTELRLTIMKESIIQDLENLIMKQLHFNKAKDYDALTQAKKSRIQLLKDEIAAASTFTDISNALEIASQINGTNPLAKHRRARNMCFFKPYGKTTTIGCIKKIYETHMIDKLSRKEIIEKHDQQIRLII